MVQTAINLPYRNIRDMLGLHAKVSPHKPFIVTFDEKHERHELTYVEFTGRVHQVANLLYDDLKIERGDVVAICGSNDENVVLIIVACWIVGAEVVLLAPDADVASMTTTLQESAAKVLFTQGIEAETLQSVVDDTQVMGIVQVDGTPQDGMLDFKDAVANRPTTFLGDDSGAKGADIPLKGGNKRTAGLDDNAVWIASELSLTQYQLMMTASSLAQAQAITGNQNLMAVLPLHRIKSLVGNLMVTMISGATLIMMQSFDAKVFWERVIKENIHVAVADANVLQSLLDFAKSNADSDDTIFGQGIDRRQMKHFRHFLGLHDGLPVELARDFEETLGVPIISTYGTDQSAGFATLLPITLSWDDHQMLLHSMSNLCVGCELAGKALEIEESNWGEIVVLVIDNEETDDTGYYQQGDDERAYLFITPQKATS